MWAGIVVFVEGEGERARERTAEDMGGGTFCARKGVRRSLSVCVLELMHVAERRKQVTSVDDGRRARIVRCLYARHARLPRVRPLYDVHCPEMRWGV